MKPDEGYKEYATPTQWAAYLAVHEYGSARAAEKALGLGHDSISAPVRRMKAYAASKGYAPENDMTRTVPDGFSVKGVSSYYDSDGQLKGQWVKSRADDERRIQLIREAFAAMAGELPRLPPVDAPPACLDSLANLYTFTDYHLGMLAWRLEGGADWDLKIAERMLLQAYEHMVSAAPAARVAIINIQGDFLHSDGLTPVTPTSGHVLDQDGRFSKIVQAAIRVIRRLCDLALMRHQEVHLILCEGNHDLASSVWLRHMFAALYDHEPRLSVNDSELPYYVYEHGKVMLAFHHGHMKKNDQLPLLFAAQFPEVWGRTTRRYCHTGHRHHVEEKEHSGMTVTQHPTLAARDAYAARGGWFAERAAVAITYHKEHGQVARSIVVPEMLDALAA